MTKVFALLVMLTAGLGPVAEPEYVAAGNDGYSDDLKAAGYVNGKMDPDRMLSFRGCLLERDAAYMYSLLYEAAERDGIKLETEDCYRTFSEQKAGFERRCPWTEVPASASPGASGAKKMRICSGPPIAPPGKSNHGWGRAIDFKQGRGVLSCYSKDYHWLKNNAHRFGWVNPAWARCGLKTQEPWHWEFAGVTDPTLVEYVEIDVDKLPPAE